MVPIQSYTLQPGVYPPLLTPFEGDSENIDYTAYASNVARLAKAGVGLLLGGTLGEGALLDGQEKAELAKCARQTVDGLDLERRIPIISGITGSSVKECVAQAEEAASAGADAVIAAVPAYFAFTLGKNEASIKGFFTDVADKISVPLLIYNIPFAAGGIDLDAYMLMELSEHQNIAGVKLTCGNIAKGYRLALHVNSEDYRDRHSLPFLVLPGSSDYLLPAIIGRQHGCIAGPANLYPKTCIKLFETAMDALDTGNFEKLKEAQALQDLITEADSVINKIGFPSIKTVTRLYMDRSLGGGFRKPLRGISDSDESDLMEGLAKALEYESSL